MDRQIKARQELQRERRKTESGRYHVAAREASYEVKYKLLEIG